MAVAITRSEIPDSAFTHGLESLALWALMSLEFMNNGESYQEAAGINIERVQQSLFRAYDKNPYMSMRTNLRLQSDYSTGNYGALWEAVNPYYDGTLPDEYKQ
ncbi:MAG: hypothetical protein AAGF93_12240 [Cyanobacteria bacterium P01_H01_bin.105]